jgi:phosphohistidine phosphatase
VAKYLRLIGVRPDRIIASPAIRTKQTAESIATQYNINKVEFIDMLYNGNPTPGRNPDLIYLSIARKTKASAGILMIVGHNDDLTNFARYLSADGVPSMKK